MAKAAQPAAILVMGVSGSGKTEIGRRLAERLRWAFRDADAFHPAENVAKMRAGSPLDDADRDPWLAVLAAVLADAVAQIEKARDGLGASAMHLGGLGLQGDRPGAMLCAVPFLNQFGNVALAVEAARQATVALGALSADGLPEAEQRFYRGKIANLKFYVGFVVPEATALGRVIRGGDRSCLDEGIWG